ncbi:hypothetical protein [Accumulibacter sp.]|uniref:hypothetical protein n=1 Tax=Accumulibacter sp. TaxID=2053492 RepID=UPI0028C37A82|nr:hypothetical protein [Accumulibacter sp.]
MTVAGGRVYARRLADGKLPARLTMLAVVPQRAIALQCALALLLLWSASFKSLLTDIGLTPNLCAAATGAGLIRLKLREGPCLQVTGWSLTPLVFLLEIPSTTVAALVQPPTERL